MLARHMAVQDMYGYRYGAIETWTKTGERAAVSPEVGKGKRDTCLVLLVELHHALKAAGPEQVLGFPLDLSHGRSGNAPEAVWGE